MNLHPWPILAALAAFATQGAVAAADQARQPNVVLIIADDLGYGDVSCYGQGRIKTPAIDRLAAEGMRFTDGYAPASTCTPTRYGMLTGEFAWRKKGTGILPGDSELIISPSRTTLASIFQKAGYATAAVGKWHLGMGKGKPDFNQRITPGLNELGFSYSFNMAATGDRVPCVYMENGLVVGLDPKDPITVSYGRKVGDWPTLTELRAKAAKGDKAAMAQVRMDSSPGEGHADTVVNGIGRIGFMTGGKAALWDDRTLSDTFTDKALRFIEQNKDRPFFLYYAAHEPHVPRDPNPRFIGKSGVGRRGDAVLQLDESVGRILGKLRDAGIDKDTIVIFSSDNGPAVADGYEDHAMRDERKTGHNANGNLRGGKYSDYEGGVRMPFIVRWPGRVKAGSTSSAVVNLVDLPATAAALTGQQLAPADAPDSFNLVPVLTGKAAGAEPFLLLGNPGNDMRPSAIREGKWKLIVKQQGRCSYGRTPREGIAKDYKAPQLFDIEKDPGETTDLAARHPEVVKRLGQLLDDSVKAGFTRPGATRAPKR